MAVIAHAAITNVAVHLVSVTIRNLNMHHAKSQIEILMNALFPVAEKLLSERNTFHPFGGYLNTYAEVIHVGFEIGHESSDAADGVEILVDAFRLMADREEAIAIAIATEMSLPNSDGSRKDAVRLFLEHRTGYCTDVLFWYERKNGAVALTSVTSQQGVPIIWGAEALQLQES